MTAHAARWAFAVCLLGFGTLHGLGAAPARLQPDSRPVDRDDAYWTAERQAAARPAPLPVAGGPEACLDAFPPPLFPPFLQGEPTLANVSASPYRSVGRLFFSTPDGDEWCSAEFVGPNIVLTAAHCVRSVVTGRPYARHYFVRAYEGSGKKPTGQPVSLECELTWNLWPGTGFEPSYRYDYAFFHTVDASDGGWMDLAFPFLGIPWAAIGYPGNYGSGKAMYQVLGSEQQLCEGQISLGEIPMGAGSSGGAWVLELGPVLAGDEAIGLTSHLDSRMPGAVYSPRFDPDTIRLMRAAAAPCP